MQDEPYRRIPLRNRQGDVAAEALVDASDYRHLNRWDWHLADTGYARRDEYSRELGRSISYTMHRVILGLERGDPRQGDHINRDRLDNRRHNLRIVPRGRQGQNKAGWGKSSVFRGVCWDKNRQLWHASVQADKTFRNLGRFNNEIDAALAAHRARCELMPLAELDPALVERGVI